MGDKEEKEIYDTSIYIDYADLPKEKQKELYTEFLDARKDEKKLSKYFFFVPIISGCLIALLLLSSGIAGFIFGVGVTFIVLVMTACVVLLCFIVVKIKLDKVKYEHELRFADWLKAEKRVIAVIKEKK